MNALKELGELPRDEFLASYLVCSAAERSFQVAIQAALDIGATLLAEAGTDVPSEYHDIFPKLAEIDVLPLPLANRLINMSKFRNVLVHLYMEIDLERLYSYIQNNLDDFNEFARHVSTYIEHIE